MQSLARQHTSLPGFQSMGFAKLMTASAYKPKAKPFADGKRQFRAPTQNAQRPAQAGNGNSTRKCDNCHQEVKGSFIEHNKTCSARGQRQ